MVILRLKLKSVKTLFPTFLEEKGVRYVFCLEYER